MYISFSDYYEENGSYDYLFRFYFLLESKNPIINTIYSSGSANTRNGSFYIELNVPLEQLESINDNEKKQLAIYYIKLKLNEIIKNGYTSYKTYIDDLSVYPKFDFNKSESNFDINLALKKIQVPDSFYIEHNYWHIQIHPNNDYWNRELELLQNKKCIGVSDSKKEVVDAFCHELDVGDIVLVRHRSYPLALVEVIGDSEFKKDSKNNDLDWFEWRRSIRLLKYYDSFDSIFFPMGILKKAINKNSPSYRYIDNLYRNYLGLQNRFNRYELISIDIKKYKQFNNFSCSFTDKNKDPLPVITLIGENGVGKTSLLEAIDKVFKRDKNAQNTGIIEITLKQNGKINKYNNIDKKQAFNKSYSPIIYLPAYISNFKSVNTLIVKYINKLIRSKNYRALEAYTELRNDINDVLENLNSSFSFNKIDENDNVYFMNQLGVEVTSEELSTGEKNILTKALFLHLSDIEGKILLIDEPELSLHPSWQRKILSVYNGIARNHNCQIILATHSPLLLSEAKEESIRILRFNDEKKVECTTPNVRSYGQKASDIMLDIMGLNSLRSPTIQERLDDLNKMISNSNFEKEKFNKELNKLEKKIGSDDIDIGFLKIDAKNREKEEK